MKVLLADDSEFILETLREMLGSFAQVEIVKSCRNGTDALEALKMLKPDLAIVDIKMPGLTGIEVLNEIRKQDKTLKFIILTLFSSSYHQQLATQAGVDYFFSKADDFEKIPMVVKELLISEALKNQLQ
ncbi:MAG: response regulator transcription factor [Prolixibacteraceae bacterium]|jgi:DNA-binding NarL/FixJ family response regulator